MHMQKNEKTAVIFTKSQEIMALISLIFDRFESLNSETGVLFPSKSGGRICFFWPMPSFNCHQQNKLMETFLYSTIFLQENIMKMFWFF